MKQSDKKNFQRDLTAVMPKDDVREKMSYLIFEEGCVLCTNANILLKQSLEQHRFTPDEIKQLNGKKIHRDVFKEIYRYDYVHVVDGKLECKKGMAKATFELQETGDWFNWKVIFPQGRSVAIDHIGVGIDLMTLVGKVTLADQKTVRLEFYGQNRGILVRGSGYSTEESIILMPRMLPS